MLRLRTNLNHINQGFALEFPGGEGKTCLLCVCLYENLILMLININWRLTSKYLNRYINYIYLKYTIGSIIVFSQGSRINVF